MEKVEITKVTGVNGANYFLSEVKGSTVVEVKFSDGTINKYAGDQTLNTGDVYVVGPGCKSSYAIGEIVKIASSTGKTGHLAKSVMTFKKDPKKNDIKKCFDGIKPVTTMKDLDAFISPYDFYLSSAKDIVISDVIVSNILKALTVLTYPKFASERMLEESRQYLSNIQSMPKVMFGSAMNKKFGDEFVQMGFSGYYPGWKEELRGLSVWSDDAVKEEYDPIDDEDGLLIYGFTGNETIKKAFTKNAEFNAFFNRMVFLSAFAVMIRGNLENLLKTALSVKMPIAGFYKDIVDLARSLEQEACIKLLQETDYPNLKFESTKHESEKTASKAISAPGFVIDDQTLIKYKGKDEIVTIPEGIKIIGDRAFCGNESVKKIIIPNTVTQIKQLAMAYCSGLEEVVFSKNLSSIGTECFTDCKKLKAADLGDTKVKTISKGLFGSCYALSSVILPKQVKKINEYAFNADSFDQLIIPASVEYIDFYVSGRMKNVIFEGTEAIRVSFLSQLSYRSEMTVHCKKGTELWSAIEEQIKRIDEDCKKWPDSTCPSFKLVEI